MQDDEGGGGGGGSHSPSQEESSCGEEGSYGWARNGRDGRNCTGRRGGGAGGGGGGGGAVVGVGFIWSPSTVFRRQ